MDDLQSLLGKSLPAEPPQVKLLKNYVKEKYDDEASVMVTQNSYILSVKSSGLAANLQHEIPDIKRACELDKPLRIRISY